MSDDDQPPAGNDETSGLDEDVDGEGLVVGVRPDGVAVREIGATGVEAGRGQGRTSAIGLDQLHGH